MAYQFRVTVEPLSAEGAKDSTPMVFEISNHDDVIELVSRIRALSVVGENEAEEFTMGLKLLGNIALKHKRDPLFAEFFTHFGQFMKKLKENPAPT